MLNNRTRSETTIDQYADELIQSLVKQGIMVVDAQACVMGSLPIILKAHAENLSIAELEREITGDYPIKR